ncbi:hypothetical protein OC834_005199 [Tilletia horrida]|nr:hypothetical protein OC834_005199 [Tilletia horrida]
MSEVLSRNLSLSMEAEIKAQITDATHARGDTAGLAQLASAAITATRTGRFDQSTDASLEEVHLVAATTHTSSWFSFLFELGKYWPTSDPIRIKFFDQKRAPTLRIFGKKMFQERFTRYTKGVFRLLDWSNVCVAGGAVLACLTSASQDEAFFAGNDIDVFLYGLSPRQSFAKLAAILSAVDKAVQGFDRVYKIVLSSGVITFMPHSEHSG